MPEKRLVSLPFHFLQYARVCGKVFYLYSGYLMKYLTKGTSDFTISFHCFEFFQT